MFYLGCSVEAAISLTCACVSILTRVLENQVKILYDIYPTFIKICFHIQLEIVSVDFRY